MIDMKDIGQNFMRRESRRGIPGEEGFTPQIPGAPQQVSIGQPQPFAPFMGQPQVAPPPPGFLGQGIPEGGYIHAQDSITGRPEGVTLTPEQLEAGRGQLPSQWELENRLRGGQVGTSQQPFTPIGNMPPPGGQAGGTSVEPGAGGFPYPQQWQTATDIYGQLAGGMPAITPEYAQQAWLPYQRQGQQEAMQAREQAGLGGLRWSTPLAGRLEDIWGGASERFGAGMEQMRMQDIQNQRQAMLGAAGGLGGLGGQYAQLPLTVSQTMMGLGGAQQQMQQAELDRYLQEFLRTQPEYNPLLQYQSGGATGFGMAPGVYQPSFGSQMFGLSGQLGMGKLMGLY